MVCPPSPGRRRRPITSLLSVSVLLLLSLTACEQPDDALAASPDIENALRASLDDFNNPDPNATGPTRNQDLTDKQIYPKDNWWNLEVTDFPVDPNSADYIAFIGNDMRTHPDFAKPPYGIPYIVVPGDQPLEPITYVKYGSESDSEWSGRPGGFPIPVEARTEENWIQQGVPGGHTTGDRHLSIIDRDNLILYELWNTYWNVELQRWEAGSGAVFDLKTNDRRPKDWTSADAAGMALFPGYVRHDEVFGPDEIEHAFRVTLSTTNGYVWPANHKAGATQGALPMGARLRLKPDVDLSGFPPEAQKIFRALKKYGLIVADNGGPLFITGTMDPRWDNHVLNPAFHALTGKDFEVLELGYHPETTEPPTSPPQDPPTDNQPPTADPGGPYSADVGVAIEFDGSGSSDREGEVSKWVWDFGDGTTGSGAKPSHAYQSKGEYVVKLVVEDGDGATSEPVQTTAAIKEVVSDPPPDPPSDNQPPSADAGGPYSTDVGATVQFDGSGSSDREGEVVSWFWDFGDGTNGRGEKPTHVYTDGGEHVVELYVKDDHGATSAPVTAKVMVHEEAVSDISLRTRILHSKSKRVRLDWEGAAGERVDIEVNGVVVRSTRNDGATNHKPRGQAVGAYIFRLCEQNTQICSNPSTVDFGGAPTVSAGDVNIQLATRADGKRTVRLDWSGAPGSRVDIERNGVVQRSTTNDGATKDRVPASGTYSYKICERGTARCSTASVTVVP